MPKIQPLVEKAEYASDAVPAQRLIIVTCMDARLEPLANARDDLKIGDAHVLRNAGGVVTPDVLRSIIVSQRRLETRRIEVYRHTKCGMAGLDADALRQEIVDSSGGNPSIAEAVSQIDFHEFADLAISVREDVAKLTNNPLVLKDSEIPISGWIYDLDKETVQQVLAEGKNPQALAVNIHRHD